MIALTRNYAFFNLLTVSLCVLALDDAWWARVLPRRINPLITQPAPVGSVRLVPRGFLLAAAIFVIGYTALLALPDFDRGRPPPVWFAALQSAVAPFASFNNYGLFAVMTTSRPELVIQGSDDGRDWQDLKRGALASTFDPQTISFGRNVSAKFVKIVALSGFGADKTTALADLAVIYTGPKLPADAQTTDSPGCSAIAANNSVPRPLKEPIGLAVSSLAISWQRRAASRALLVSAGESRNTGTRGMTPRAAAW